MLFLLFALGIVLNATMAALSGNKLLFGVASVMAVNFTLSEALGAVFASIPYRDDLALAYHLRPLLYAGIDFVSAIIIFYLLNKMSAPWLKGVFVGTYAAMACGHFAKTFLAAPSFYKYDELLSYMTAVQILACIATSFLIVFLLPKAQTV